MRIETRLRQLEARHEQAIEAEVKRLASNPRVERYLDTLPDSELRQLAQGDTDALQRFALACEMEGG